MQARAKKSGKKSQTKAKGSSHKYVLRPDRRVDLPFSDAIWTGSTLYLAGHIGFDPATSRPPVETEREIRLMLDSLKTTLSAAGLEMRHLVYVQIFCSDISLFAEFNTIYRTYFEKPFPTRAFIGSGPLLFGAKFEIQGIASRD
ncbi:MAG TPA: RidA family protein [Candidatus Acidoferrales bacterium]|nr:RidA family protein [Candidatus Acidoferrales bacterium]